MKNKRLLSLLLVFCIISATNIRCDLDVLRTLLEGFMRSSNGSDNIAGGSVDLDSPTGDNPNTIIRSTTTNGNGFYQFIDIPSGRYNVIFRKGSFVDTAFDIDVSVDFVATANGNVEPRKKLAYLPGDRDNIQQILRDTLGYDSLVELDFFDFDNIDTLNQFSIIFINGSTNSSSFTIPQQDNVSAYLLSGGNVYASDAGVFAFCSLIANLGVRNCGIDNYIGDPGLYGSDIQAQNLILSLGKDTATISYFESNWFSIEDTVQNSQGVNVYTKGTYTVHSGDSTITNRVLSFSYDLRPGQPGGLILYTNFRNEPNSSPTQDVIDILKFYVFEL